MSTCVWKEGIGRLERVGVFSAGGRVGVFSAEGEGYGLELATVGEGVGCAREREVDLGVAGKEGEESTSSRGVRLEARRRGPGRGRIQRGRTVDVGGGRRGFS